jgi:hypothetical protein
MDVTSRRVSSKYAGRGRLSRGSLISWSGEVEFWVGTTRFGGVGLAAAVLTLAAAFFLDFPAVRFGLLWIWAQVLEAWQSPWWRSL